MRRSFHPAITLLSFWTLVHADDELIRLRNLGKAFYENPTTQKEAVEQFRRALALEPNSARERLNYGLSLLRAGKFTEGVAELERTQKQDPSIPHTWFNLGIQYKKQGETERAISQLQQMVKLVSDDPISHYNLAVTYKLAGKLAEALGHFEKAAKLDGSLAGPHFQLFNAYRSMGRQADAKRELDHFQAIKKQQEGAPIPEDMEWSLYSEIYDPVEAKPMPVKPPTFTTRNLGLKDVRGVAGIDADADGAPDVLAWSRGGLMVLRSGASILKGAFPPGEVLWAAPGDFDNDGLTDVVAGTSEGVTLFRNLKGKFAKVMASLPQGQFNSALWLDFDHDYDLDLMLLGRESKLMRNEGAAGFADRTSAFPFVGGEALAGTVYRVVPDTRGFDVAVVMSDGRALLYRDKLAGSYEVEPLKTGGAKKLRAVDANHDGVFELVDAKDEIEADFDGDGDLDVVARLESGDLERHENQATGLNWITVELAGVKNLKRARGAEVEVKAGALYRKQTYEETPLVFELGPYQEADVVRITWPNGLIQNEVRQAGRKKHLYKEAQRLSGSCPMIFTWNGQEFEFITDVLGVAPLGASAGDGKFFPTDHDEYIQIPAESLKVRDGHFEVRITEELSEVAYLDSVSLIAVDHPDAIRIVTNDKFKGPPFPEFRLFGITKAIPPLRAEQNGVDVLKQVLHRDRAYADQFRRTLDGAAEMWSLELTFSANAAPNNEAVLVLSGWVDWADGSTFLGKAQERSPLVTPYLQVRNANGEWATVIEDMGMPAGKPKTIAVDLTGKFLSASREVRIVTNVAVYWDEVFLSEEVKSPDAKLTAIAGEAELNFRGFSRPVIHPERKQPEAFLYSDVLSVTAWNQTPGLYTRYGPVSELLKVGDDRMVLMGSGDELRLRFSAQGLAPLPSGWKRDFLLKVEGWAKDRDANTAFSQSVEPLPFRGMSTYPYPEKESYPTTEVHQNYLREYNTRPALRPLRPLRNEVSRLPQ
jgi:hypothetical protein